MKAKNVENLCEEKEEKEQRVKCLFQRSWKTFWNILSSTKKGTRKKCSRYTHNVVFSPFSSTLSPRNFGASLGCWLPSGAMLPGLQCLWHFPGRALTPVLQSCQTVVLWLYLLCTGHELPAFTSVSHCHTLEYCSPNSGLPNECTGKGTALIQSDYKNVIGFH